MTDVPPATLESTEVPQSDPSESILPPAQSWTGDPSRAELGASLSRWTLAAPLDYDKATTEGATPPPSSIESEAPTRPATAAEPAPATPPRPRFDDGPSGAAYILRRRIGQGGMGEVWEATQASLGRRVAVKRARRDAARPLDGEDEGAMSARLAREFRQEACLTARLDHPNIVPVHDLGEDEKGSPLLAMKLAEGASWQKTLRDDFKALSPADVLAKHLPILVDVAQAVAFAHARGIVHRDIKPGQVIVGDFGETLLMDWGLAMRVDERDAEDDLHLAHLGAPLPDRSTAGNPCGTPAYMAPEQTEETAENIGPWTDVFLLGGTLYHILTGGYVPRDAKMPALAIEQARRGVLAPPSERAPGRSIPPELESLCLKAMAFKPEERLPSASAFVEALQDYSTGASKRRESEELVAQARSALDAFRGVDSRLSPAELYARRGGVADLADQALRLWPGNSEARSLRLANLASRVEEEIAHGDLILAQVHLEELSKGASPEAKRLAGSLGQAERKRRSARRQRIAFAVAAVAALLGMLGAGWWATAQSARVAEVDSRRQEAERLKGLFERVNELRRAENDLADQMAAVAPLPQVIVWQPGGPDSAERIPARDMVAPLLAKRSLLREERRQLAREKMPLEPEPFALALADANLEVLNADSQEGNLRAYELYERAAKARPGAQEPLTGMGIAAARAGYPATGSKLLEEAAGIIREARGEASLEYSRALAQAAEAYRLLNEDSPEYLTLYAKSMATLEPRYMELGTELADRMQVLGRYDEALDVSSATLRAAERAYGPASREAGSARVNYAEALAGIGSPEETVEIALRGVEEVQDGFGPDSMETARALGVLGRALHQLGRFDEAAETLEEAAAALERSGRPDEVIRDGLTMGLIAARMAQGRFADAEDLSGELLRNRVDRLGPKHPTVASTLNNFGLMRLDAGQLDSAEPLLLRAMEIYREAGLEGHPATASVLNNLALLRLRQSRLPEARRLFEEAIGVQAKSHGPDSDRVAHTMGNLAGVFATEDRFEEAAEIWSKSLEIRLRRLPPEHPDILSLKGNLAAMYSELGRFDEARTLQLESIDALESSGNGDNPQIVYLLHNLGLLEEKMGLAEEGIARLRACREKAERIFGAESPMAFSIRGALASSLLDAGGRDEALALLRENHEAAKRTTGPTGDLVGSTGVELAVALHRTGLLSESAETMARSVEAMRRHLPPGHPQLCSALANLGGVMLDSGAPPAEVERALRESVEGYESGFGPESERLIHPLNILATCYGMQGKNEEALEAMERLLAILEPLVGPDNEEVARKLATICVLKRQLGRYDEAEKDILRAWEIWEESNPRSDGAAANLDEQADLYVAQGNRDRAKQARSDQLAILDELLAEAPGRADLLLQAVNGRLALASFAALDGDGEACESEARRVSIYLAVFDAIDPASPLQPLLRVRALALLGRGLALRGKEAEAVEAWTEAFELVDPVLQEQVAEGEVRAYPLLKWVETTLLLRPEAAADPDVARRARIAFHAPEADELFKKLCLDAGIDPFAGDGADAANWDDEPLAGSTAPDADESERPDAAEE